jgi:hypothetical protein
LPAPATLNRFILAQLREIASSIFERIGLDKLS